MNFYGYKNNKAVIPYPARNYGFLTTRITKTNKKREFQRLAINYQILVEEGCTQPQPQTHLILTYQYFIAIHALKQPILNTPPRPKKGRLSTCNCGARCAPPRRLPAPTRRQKRCACTAPRA